MACGHTPPRTDGETEAQAGSRSACPRPSPCHPGRLSVWPVRMVGLPVMLGGLWHGDQPARLPDPSASTPEPLGPPYRLQQVQIPLEEDEDCEQAYGKYLHKDSRKVIPEDMLCAGSLGRGPCMVRRLGQSCPGVSSWLWPAEVGHLGPRHAL